MRLIIFFSFALCSFAQGQSLKLLSSIDSTFIAGNQIIEQNDFHSYFKKNIGNKTIDIQNINQNLLNAALHFALNKIRNERNKNRLKYSPDLEFLAYNCTHFYTSSKFKTVKKGREKYERVLYLASREMNITQHLISTNVGYVALLNKKSNKKIYRAKNSNNKTTYYYLESSKKNPKTDEKVHIYTYNELAEKIVNEFSKYGNKSFLMSKSFEISACYIQIDKKTIGRNRSPMFKIIQIVGGKRLILED